MKKWLVIFIVVLIACNKEKESDTNGDIVTPVPFECDIKIKVCTPQEGDTVYIKWIDNSQAIKEAYIKSCLYIITKFYTGDTIHFEYQAIQNNLEMIIYVNQVAMFDTVFLHTTIGIFDYIVEAPDKLI